MQLVIKPFQAFSYFFDGKTGIYYSVPTEKGDLYLKYFDGDHSTDVARRGEFNIPVDKPGPGIGASPFYSFSVTDYADAVLPSMNVGLVELKSDIQKLTIAAIPYLTFTKGKGWDGYYYCSEKLRSVFLPGDRFFLFNAPYCENYSGQLLIDTMSGQYEELPPKTIVYTTANTETYKGYRITVGGIKAH